MIKKIVLLLSIAVLSLDLCGCHGKREIAQFVVPETFDETREYDLVFWAKNDSNRTQKKAYEQAISSFEELYPNIHITMKIYNDYTKIYNDVITNISTNTTPNVCITYPDHIATYLTGNNVVVELDELMENDKYGLGKEGLRFDAPKKEEIVEEFLQEGIISEHYYALPFMRSTEALYINKDFVEKLGYEVPDVLTWDFIYEVSNAAKQKDDNGLYKLNGQNVMIPFIYKSTDNMMITMLKQLEGDYSNEAGEILLFNDTTSSILKELSPHAANGAFSTFKISSYPANFLNAGQSVFAIDSTAGATWMGTHAPQLDIPEDRLVEFETLVRPIPQYDTENLKMMSQGPSICIFNKTDAQEVLASWLFAQYLLTNRTQISYARTEGYVPVTLKAQIDPSYLEYLERAGEDNDEFYDIKIAASKLCIRYTEDTFITPVFNGSVSLRNAAGQLIEEVTKASKNNQVIDDAYLDKLYDNIASLFNLDQISGSVSGNEEEGPLPLPSVILLLTLGIVWIFIGFYAIKKYLMKKS